MPEPRGVQSTPLPIGQNPCAEVRAPSGDADAVLGRFTADGSLSWAAAATGSEDQVPAGIGRGADGDVIVALTTSGTTDLGGRI